MGPSFILCQCSINTSLLLACRRTFRILMFRLHMRPAGEALSTRLPLAARTSTTATGAIRMFQLHVYIAHFTLQLHERPPVPLWLSAPGRSRHRQVSPCHVFAVVGANVFQGLTRPGSRRRTESPLMQNSYTSLHVTSSTRPKTTRTSR